MKLTLKDFQDEAVAQLATLATRARGNAREGEPQTLTLAAPTGAGKTVIATAWMERLLQGDADHAPDPDAVFLWITDQPELNEQTRKKILGAATAFADHDLITIDTNFDQQSFLPGKVYFLNTQKLGKDKHLVARRGDRRDYTIWDTINNTVATHADSLWVIIDEAHRGMGEDKSARTEARTIVQKFIKGSGGEIEPVPLILGISATPERFAELITGTPRTNRPSYNVDPDRVRISGLLKETITLYYPEEQQPSDLTLLKNAGTLLKRYETEWAAYAEHESAPLVRPVLVVQVEDATKQKTTKTDVPSALLVLEEALGPLTDAQIAHAFQEGHSIKFGDRTIRYVAPSDIEGDTDLRVVLFKRSLTTGWDCPRAEVMMSFRRAIDRTLIAQLIGRMVRTPLARLVSASDFLNSVSLYLPYYDDESLKDVIEYLTHPDPEIGFPARVQRGDNLATFRRNSKVKDAFAAAESLPTIQVDKVSKQSNTRRLLRLGRLLAWDKLDVEAPKVFTIALVGILAAEHTKAKKTGEFKKRVKEAAVIDVRAVTVGYGETKARAEEGHQLAAVSANVDHAFAECGRKLGAGLHLSYLEVQAAAKGAPSVSQIKLELYALLQDTKVIDAVESAAAVLLHKTDQQHRAAIKELPDQRRQLYRHVRRQAGRPEAEDWELPPSIEASKTGRKARPKHLYSSPDGTFPCTLNRWEEKVIDEALADSKVIGWLRNEPRKPWAFSIAYRKAGEDHPMYPDVLVFRRDGGGVLCDIYEPHALAFEDSVGKAKGLAEFARDHGEKFGRIQLLAELKKGAFKRLRLDDTKVRDNVLGVDGPDHLRQLFEQAEP